MNQTFIILLIIGIFSGIMSFIRVIDSGLQIAHYVHGGILVVLGLIFLFKKYLQYNVRLGLLIAITLIIGSVGFLSYGLLGQGQFFLTCAVTFACVFSGKRVAIPILIFSALIIVSFMYLFSSSIIKISFDPAKYLIAPSSWINLLLSFVLFIGMVLSIIKGLFSSLSNSTLESMNQVAKINQLNETLEEKVLVRTSELYKSNKDKDKIIGIVAHDINNKLGCIMGYLEMLNEDYTNISNENRLLFARKSLEASMLARDIVSELLEFAKINNIDHKMIKEPIDISSFVKSTVECHIPDALEKKITLSMPQPSELMICKINRAKFSRVIDNLITNAISVTPEGGTVTIELESQQDGIIIKFKDSGSKIPDNIKATIFEPFSMSQKISPSNDQSSGLGLSISHKIVEQHSGKLWVESEEHNGNNFFLFLPKATNNKNSSDS